MQIDIYCDESRLEFLTSLCFAMQATETKKPFVGLKHLVKANSKDGEQRATDVIKNWIRNRGTLEFIGTWEKMYNPDFKMVEFDHFKMDARLASFVLSPLGRHDDES